MTDFMEPQIEFGKWWKIETDQGTECFPADLVQPPGDVEGDVEVTPEITAALADFLGGNEIYSAEVVVGWGARLSAPGYMDCTDWAVFETEQEAKDYLAETYDVEFE